MASKLARISVMLALVLATLGGSYAAPTRTDNKISYHGGPLMYGTSGVYFVWYGCWGLSGCGNALAPYNDLATMNILSDFIQNVGGSPYFQINAGYPGAWGNTPSGALLYGGSVADRYSRGLTLTEADVAGIVTDRIESNGLPQDPSGIYVVLASSDVTLVDGATQFCLTCCNFHGTGMALGSQIRVAFVGNPSRCPGACAAQFEGVASPNANYAADAMAAWLAHSLNAIVTNPTGGGWFDRYGLENSDKCEGTFGPTQTVTNPDGLPAESNMRLGGRDYLLQQNWVNSKKGHCALNISQ